MTKEFKIALWLPVLLAAGTLATMILLDRRRRRNPIFDADEVECESGTYLSERGCTRCPKWITKGKAFGRAIPPACIGKEEDISRLWGARRDNRYYGKPQTLDDFYEQQRKEKNRKDVNCPDGQRLHTSNLGAGNFTQCLTPDQIKKANLFSVIA